MKEEVQADIDSLNEALKGEDLDAIKAGITKLGESSQKLGAAMYEQEAASAAQSEEDGEDVVEAEIVDEEVSDESAEDK